MMNSGEIEERVSRWESLNARGEVVSPEELCAGHPELIDEVGRRIRALESIDRLMESVNVSYASTSRTRDRQSPQAEEQDLPSCLGRYRLESLLGSGGFGQVWRGYDPQLERFVAIKVPRPDRMASPLLREAFLKEARKVAQLRHPSIVPVYDFGQDGPYYFIVWELIEGGSLAEQMRQTQFTLQETVAIVVEVAEALNFAHLRDIIHRDIKPANILLDKRGKAYVTDFGIAVTEDELLEEHGAVSGTLAYMSPEQASGNSLCVNARTDIYSLGVVLYEMLTGRLPFKAKTFDSLRKCVVSGEPRPPRTINDGIPLELESICLKAMSKQLTDRFSTASDMANSLRNALRPQGPPRKAEQPEMAKQPEMADCVGKYRWRTSDKTIDFDLHEDGTFLAHQTPDPSKNLTEIIVNMVRDGKGTWNVLAGRLTITMTHVGKKIGWKKIGLWKRFDMTWINDQKITAVTATEILLEYSNPLTKILASDR